jgi:hypothetical protein
VWLKRWRAAFNTIVSGYEFLVGGAWAGAGQAVGLLGTPSPCVAPLNQITIQSTLRLVITSAPDQMQPGVSPTTSTA